MRVTKADKILILCIILLSLASLGWLFMRRSAATNQEGKRYASISVDGKEQMRIALDASNEGRTFVIDSPFGHNVLEVHEGGIHMKEANCPDQICVHEGEIRVPGEIIVCLPARLYVTVRMDSKQKSDDPIVPDAVNH